jgi:hypothetical protein
MKLIATNISNLTDARFFATYSPELLVTGLTALEDLADQLVWIEQVRPWVAGPSWALCLDQNLDQDRQQNLVQAGVHTIVYSGTPGSLRPLKGLSYIMQGTVRQINNLGSDRTKFVAAIITDASSMSQILENLTLELYVLVEDPAEWSSTVAYRYQISGVAVPGGTEEKVGLKSYDNIINMLDHLFS